MLALLGLIGFAACYFKFVHCDFLTLISHFIRTKIYSREISFYNKTVWLIGASSGIGEYVAYEIAKSGASRLIVSSRRREQLERVVANATKDSEDAPNTSIVCLDLADFAADERAAADCVNQVFEEHNNKIDIVIINSGITQRGVGLDTDVDVAKRLMEINCFGVMSLTKAVCRKWKDVVGQDVRRHVASNGKHVLAITTSLAGRIGAPGQSAYAASKHAITGWAEALRMELSNDPIDISLVAPGYVRVTENSFAGIGDSLDQDSGRKNSKTYSSALSTERCAELYVSAVWGHITESWISLQPNLFFLVGRQFCPWLIGPLGSIVGPSRVRKLQAEKNKAE